MENNIIHHMRKLLLLALLMAMSIAGARAQSTPARQVWATLGKVTFVGGTDVLTMNTEPPVYGKEVLALEGKEVTIEGYVMPLDFGKAYFVISAFPFASCFFCGGAGPETVMEVYLRKPTKPKAEKVVVKGKLVLNHGDVEHLTYMLKDAVIVEEK
jgi:hypothetical protein